MTRMFQKIQDLIDDKDALVFVLIDEVGVFTPVTVGSAGLGGLSCFRHHQPHAWPASTGCVLQS